MIPQCGDFPEFSTIQCNMASEHPRLHLRNSTVEHLHEPLPMSRVRWYYSRTKFCANVPDVPVRGDWIRFCPADSLKLEE